MSIIDATVAGAASNSYVDLATATAYITQWRLYSATPWTALDQDTQETALIWATTLLDQLMEWKGYKTNRSQRLRWPRAAVYDRDKFYVDMNIIPDDIKQITAFFAYELAVLNRVQEPATIGLGVSQAQIGPIEVKIDTAVAIPFVPKYIQAALSFWGILNAIGAGGNTIQAKLRRV